jgi:hypothetical protein
MCHHNNVLPFSHQFYYSKKQNKHIIMTLLKNITKTFAVGVTALALTTSLSSTPSAHADTIPAGFEITGGVLTLKFVKQTDFNTTYATPSYAFGDFVNATNTTLYTNGDIATDGTTKPVASTSDVAVKGNVVLGFSNGSGKGFTSSTTLTNFADGIKVLPLCTGACATGARFSTQAISAVPSTSSTYTGQGVAGANAPTSELSTASTITTLTNATAAGVSNSFSYLNFADGTGNGEFYKKTQLNYTIPAYAQVGSYVATYTVTAVVNP